MDGRWAIPPDGTRAEGDEPRAVQNTDRELFREDTGDPAGSYYENYVFVTRDDGAIGMAVGGRVFVAPVADWHAAMSVQTAPPEAAGAAVSDERASQVSQGGSGLDAAQKAAEVLALHQVEWVDTEVGYACGCDEDGRLHLGGLADALTHQADALAAAHLLRDAPGQDAGDEGLRARVAALADEVAAYADQPERFPGFQMDSPLLTLSRALAAVEFELRRALLDPEAKP